jgi:hypothetical protein
MMTTTVLDRPSLITYTASRFAAVCEYDDVGDGIWAIPIDAVKCGYSISYMVTLDSGKIAWEMESISVWVRFDDDTMVVDIDPRDNNILHLRHLTLNDEWSFNQVEEISEGEFGRALGRGNDPARWICHRYGYHEISDPDDPEWTRLHAIYGER